MTETDVRLLAALGVWLTRELAVLDCQSPHSGEAALFGAIAGVDASYSVKPTIFRSTRIWTDMWSSDEVDPRPLRLHRNDRALLAPREVSKRTLAGTVPADQDDFAGFCADLPFILDQFRERLAIKHSALVQTFGTVAGVWPPEHPVSRPHVGAMAGATHALGDVDVAPMPPSQLARRFSDLLAARGKVAKAYGDLVVHTAMAMAATAPLGATTAVDDRTYRVGLVPTEPPQRDAARKRQVLRNARRLLRSRSVVLDDETAKMVDKGHIRTLLVSTPVVVRDLSRGKAETIEPELAFVPISAHEVMRARFLAASAALGWSSLMPPPARAVSDDYDAFARDAAELRTVFGLDVSERRHGRDAPECNDLTLARGGLI